MQSASTWFWWGSAWVSTVQNIILVLVNRLKRCFRPTTVYFFVILYVLLNIHRWLCVWHIISCTYVYVEVKTETWAKLLFNIRILVSWKHYKIPIYGIDSRKLKTRERGMTVIASIVVRFSIWCHLPMLCVWRFPDFNFLLNYFSMWENENLIILNLYSDEYQAKIVELLFE